MTLFHIAVKSFCLFICSSDGSFTPTEQHSILYTSPLYSAVNKPLQTDFTKVSPPVSFSWCMYICLMSFISSTQAELNVLAPGTPKTGIL